MEDDEMVKLWLLRGDLDAPGWNVLRADYKDKKIEIVHLDPKVWAIVEQDEPPSGYDGLTATEPPDGLYLDPNGSPMYLVGGAVVKRAEDVVKALGAEARAMLERLGDPHTVLERLGRSF
ncbi:MAG: hypothetical protein MUC56_12550 [Thermoanaerobaculales bacterium]|nr:hypothetical protein [Thermoanaerobaculales bacterium]